jgi:hypothetical protein
MEITSFLFSDDIPKELINVGSPIIEDDDINDTLEDEVGLKQVIEILTRFSLFQSTRGGSLSAMKNRCCLQNFDCFKIKEKTVLTLYLISESY